MEKKSVFSITRAKGILKENKKMKIEKIQEGNGNRKPKGNSQFVIGQNKNAIKRREKLNWFKKSEINAKIESKIKYKNWR